MRALFNTIIKVQSRIEDTDDADGNKKYKYNDLLINEQARKYDVVKTKLTDDNNLLYKKNVNFIIFDINTDLSLANILIENNKKYIIDRIIEPNAFDRFKYRIIETHLSEDDT